MTDTVDSRWAWRLRKRICVSLQLMHAAEQKQMQHCKAILLQLKFLKRNKWKMKKKTIKIKGKKPLFSMHEGRGKGKREREKEYV